ncbi:uncharacterized protein LOC124202483 [Daphnia pulex]|uniref:uncharacterized protein LOC124202483 n=1 Tax=Daphnia pulex TaxID=6669 RepID=UPI001EDD4A19|nr:uncharacterized protein LOC124202483 [Daphnia pulex]
MVLRYADVQFAEDFRMNRQRFRELYDLIGQHLEEQFYSGREPILHKLLLAIWSLSTPETFREIAHRFGYRCRGSAHHVLRKVCRVIVEHSELFVTWPARNEYANISAQFRFPFALGAIDATYIQYPPNY